jgi:ABC-2 type transport system ATP-binding protein
VKSHVSESASAATPPLGNVVIRAGGLCKSYDGTAAVADLSFTVRAGQIIGLLGPNGAGKTTTINMLTTLIPIDAGAAEVAGFDVSEHPELVRRVIGLSGQSAAVDEKLTARENLRLFGRLYKLPKDVLAARIEALVTEFRMQEFADRPAETYSGGERRRLDVVAALVANPPALFLDEPTTGLDPRSRMELWNAIERLAAGGTAIVLTTQYLEEADRLADEIVMIDDGRVVAVGTPEELKRNLERDVLEMHLAAEGMLERALALLAGTDGIGADRDAGRVYVPVGGGAESSLELLRRLDDAGVELVDFQMRRPTLDDVFLAITGPANDIATGRRTQ